MPTPDVDVDAILEALDRRDVDYVVIGGFAAELYDVAIPPTRDIDITPSDLPDNLDRLAAALNDLDARLRVLDGPAQGFPIRGGSHWAVAGVDGNDDIHHKRWAIRHQSPAGRHRWLRRSRRENAATPVSRS